MKKNLLVLMVLMFSTIGFAGGKCDAYKEACAGQILLQTMNGNEQGPSSMYPMHFICFWEGFKGSLEKDFSEWPDDALKRLREANGPTKKGIKLLEDIFEGNVKTVEEFIRSGEFSATGVTPCLLTDDMLDEMGSWLWNTFKNSAVQNGIPRKVLRFVYLDRNVCKEWGSRKVTKEDLR